MAPDGQYGEGAGLILLDEVQCLGTELSLLDCGRSEWGRHDCSHNEDVGVRCERRGETNDIPDTAPVSGTSAGAFTAPLRDPARPQQALGLAGARTFGGSRPNVAAIRSAQLLAS